MDRHHKEDNRRGLVKRLMQGEYEASKGLTRMETETLRRSGGEGGAHTWTARAVVTRAPQSQLAAHAELAANGVVECASGRAPRSTAAAWDKRETIAW